MAQNHFPPTLGTTEWQPGFATEQEAFDYALIVRSWGDARCVDVELNRDGRWSVVIINR
jgi:hypothetical protein